MQLRIRKKKNKGGRPAPRTNEKPASLQSLVGKQIELFLQSEPYAVDDILDCYLTYASARWVGVVSAYRSQLFYDHIPISTIRKIRGTVRYKDRIRSDSFTDNVDFDNPQQIVDLINEEVILYLQGFKQLEDSEFHTRIVYVKKNWLGIASVYHNRYLPDHIPLTTVRKVTFAQSIGRHTRAKKKQLYFSQQARQR